MLTSVRKHFCLLLSVTLLLVSCAGHIAQIEKPVEADKDGWFAYYDDQFKAYGENVEAPAGDASEAQVQGYVEAKEAFDSAQTTALILGILAFAIGLGSLLGTLTQL